MPDLTALKNAIAQLDGKVHAVVGELHATPGGNVSQSDVDQLTQQVQQLESELTTATSPQPPAQLPAAAGGTPFPPPIAAPPPPSPGQAQPSVASWIPPQQG